MTWGIHSIASGSSHRVAMATMVLLAILALSCRAQAFTVNITSELLPGFGQEMPGEVKFVFKVLY